MNSTRGSTPPNPNFDLPNRSTDLNKTLGIIGTPQEESIAMILSTKTCQIKRNPRNPAKNPSNPRTSKTPKSSRNLHLQYLAKNQSTQRCQSLITQGSDHPPVLKPHMVLNLPLDECIDNTHTKVTREKRKGREKK
jgi:hypothetical protein